MKRIIIDMAERTERHELSGRCYRIDRRLERRGGNIYLDRTFVGHPSIAAARTVILPRHHLWVMFFQGHPGAPHPLRCYMHMARTVDDGRTITLEDLYLDVIVRRDGRWQLLDVDEFREAVAAGELDAAQVQAALSGLEHACRFVDRAGPDIEGQLERLLEGV